MSQRAWIRILVMTVTIFYLLTNYGGVRSPDSEVVFRTGEALVNNYTFAIEPMQTWSEFGVAKGLDGRTYSIFGPLESIALVPVISIAQRIAQWSFWPDVLPQPPWSHYARAGLRPGFDLAVDQKNTIKLDDESYPAHLVRFLSSWYNTAVTALGVVIFFKWLLVLGFSLDTAGVTSLLYALATPIWTYAGTFFSEPLAILCLNATLFFMARSMVSMELSQRWMGMAGLALGLAVAAHISAIVAFPFILIPLWKKKPDQVWRACLSFGLGLFIPLVFLGLYNHLRFGSFLETGRYVDQAFAHNIGYGETMNPWPVVCELLFSPGRGLLVFSPLIFFFPFFFKGFFRRLPTWAMMVLAVVVVRHVFISSRSDWTGGYGLGPRFLLMSLPFVMLVLAEGVDWLRAQPLRWVKILGLVTIIMATIQQWYFATGEIFTFLYVQRQKIIDLGFPGHMMYSDWEFSPLGRLHTDGGMGSFVLSLIPLDWGITFWIGCILIAALWTGLLTALVRSANPVPSLCPPQLPNLSELPLDSAR